MLDLICGFRVLQVDLAFPHLFPNFHPQNLPNLPLPRGVLRVHPWIQSPNIRPDPRTSGHLGHPAPASIISIHRPVSCLSFAKFCSGSHIPFGIPPSVPHSTTAFRKLHHRLPTTNSDNFDMFCFENLSCGSRVLLCFGYLGTVRHQHRRCSSSPRTRHQQ